MTETISVLHLDDVMQHRLAHDSFVNEEQGIAIYEQEVYNALFVQEFAEGLLYDVQDIVGF